MARNQKVPTIDPHDKRLRKLAHLLDEMVEEKAGPEASFEEKSDVAAGLAGNAQWLREEWRVRRATTTAKEVMVKGVRYRQMEQPSSAVYFGRYGAHEVVEPLYRQVGAHNGPTIKPLEARVGIIGNMMPDFARIVMEHGADEDSRETERRLKIDGLVPPSRAFIAKRQGEVAHELKVQAAHLEAEARKATPSITGVSTVSCGMDRMAVRMVEPLGPGVQKAKGPHRTEPYERTPPDPKTYDYRMAWVGNTSAHDADGNLLHTWRYALDAQSDPALIARRVTAQVKALVDANRSVTVLCIQDEGKELRILPATLQATLGPDVSVGRLTDFEHLAGYLDDVVNATEADGDPRNYKHWYRDELLRDDEAIHRIWDWLLRRARDHPRGGSKAARTAIGKALRYIRKRKHRMRYATHRAANRPVGSGETEATCGLMQLRVKRAGQSWETPGLSGILSLRSIVLSGSFPATWKAFAAKSRKEVRDARHAR